MAVIRMKCRTVIHSNHGAMLIRSKRPIQGVSPPAASADACTAVSAPNTTTMTMLATA